MRKLQYILTVAAVVLPAVLAVLAVVGGFLGRDGAGKLFSSTPLVVFWFVLAAVLVVASAASGGHKNIAGSTAMHIGALLVLGGSMWGSQQAHQWRENNFGGQGPQRGFVFVREGQGGETAPIYRIASPLTVKDAELAHVGDLPFALRLNAYRTEYHSPRNGPWALMVVIHDPATGRVIEQASIDVENRQPVQPALTDIILRILDSAPAEYKDERLIMRPMVTIELSRGDRRNIVDMLPVGGQRYVELPLGFLYDDLAEWKAMMAPSIVMAEPVSIRNHYADVGVYEREERVADGVISVNHPMAYGGYHFYFQTPLNVSENNDYEPRRMVLLQVVSSAGWFAVRAGFVLLLIGAVWRYWLSPTWKALAAGRRGER